MCHNFALQQVDHKLDENEIGPFLICESNIVTRTKLRHIQYVTSQRHKMILEYFISSVFLCWAVSYELSFVATEPLSLLSGAEQGERLYQHPRILHVQ